ncbi:DedA family protein [Paenibacillus sambharensis]|uniref:DedA family protein n=1 Tax=Paenibacillus sambharensis TaxID=1803190 RepID=A0A2W1LI42_9BACL|nr:VTT domain-containing protein [Paenibacillus sambharensis]PZD97680.1 DedA family protein [Paenibacillus sambharensis]
MEFLRSFGSMGLFIHAMIDAIIFPVPAFFLQVSLSAINPENAIWLATFGYLGCLAGTPIGYALGRTSGNLILSKMMKKKWLDSASEMFRKHGESAILIGSFTPIPFKLFTIMSGVMNYPFWKLFGYAAIGRAVKFYIVGILFYMYGRAAEHMIDKVLGITLLIVGAVIFGIWLLIRKLRSRKKPVVFSQEDTAKQDSPPAAEGGL